MGIEESPWWWHPPSLENVGHFTSSVHKRGELILMQRLPVRLPKRDVASRRPYMALISFTERGMQRPINYI